MKKKSILNSTITKWLNLLSFVINWSAAAWSSSWRDSGDHKWSWPHPRRKAQKRRGTAVGHLSWHVADDQSRHGEDYACKITWNTMTILREEDIVRKSVRCSCPSAKLFSLLFGVLVYNYLHISRKLPVYLFQVWVSAMGMAKNFPW